MGDFVRFEVTAGRYVLVEAESSDDGWIPAGSGADGIARAAGRWTEHLDCIREAADQTLTAFRERLQPDEMKLSFGIKMTAEAGAVIARTAGEGHLDVELAWHRSPAPEPPAAGSAAVLPAPRTGRA